jgi:hypothetical protein
LIMWLLTDVWFRSCQSKKSCDVMWIV